MPGMVLDTVTDDAADAAVRRSARVTAHTPVYDESGSDSDTGNAKRKPAGAIPRGRKRVRAESPIARPEPFENDIFDAMWARNPSLHMLAKDWLGEYKDSAEDAMANIINFLLKSCGSDTALESHDATNDKAAAETLWPIVDETSKYITSDYVIVSRKGTRFRANLQQFFAEIVQVAAADGVLYQPKSARSPLWSLVHWVSVFSTAGLRSFRHTATVAMGAIVTALCDVYASRREEIAVIQQRLTRKSKKNDDIETIRASKRAEEAKLKVIDAYIKDVISSVFNSRCRDVDFHIRVDCTKFLAKWTQKLPEKFMSPEYVRVFGAGLSDVDAQVRHQALSALISLYSDNEKWLENNQSADFTVRFLPHIKEMALCDADPSARKSAVVLLSLLSENKFLEPDDTDLPVLYGLVLDREPRIRKAAASLFIAEARKLAALSLEDVPESTVTQLRKSSEYSSLVEDWVLLSACTRLFAKVVANDPDPEPSLQSISNKQFQKLPSRTALGAEAVFEVLGDEAPEWGTLVSQLNFDFSSLGKSRARGKISDAAVKQFVSAHTITDLALAFDVLYGLILAAMKAVSSPTRIGKARPSKDEIQDGIDEVHGQLIVALPNLLEKFKYDPAILANVLKLCMIVETDIYNKLHKDDIFEVILTFTLKAFLEEDSPVVLRECESLFKYGLTGDETKVFTQQSLAAAVDDLGYDILEKARSSSPASRSLDHLARFGAVVDIHQVVTQSWQDEKGDHTVSRRLTLPSVYAGSDGDVESRHIENVVTVLRLAIIWKLSNVAEQPFSWEHENIVRVFSDFVMELSRKQRSIDLATKVFLNLSLLDVFVAIKVTVESGHTRDGGSLDHLLDYVDLNDVGLETTWLFLELERQYIGEDTVLEESDIDEKAREGRALTDEEEQQLTELPILNVEYLLCELASKLALAGALGLLDGGITARLKLHQKLLSTRYIQLMKEVVDPLLPFQGHEV